MDPGVLEAKRLWYNTSVNMLQIGPFRNQNRCGEAMIRFIRAWGALQTYHGKALEFELCNMIRVGEK